MKLRTTVNRCATDWKLEDMQYHMCVNFLALGNEDPTSLRVVQMSSRQLICTARTPCCTTDTIVETPEDLDLKTLILRPWLSNRVRLLAYHRKRSQWGTLVASLKSSVRHNDLSGVKTVMGDLADLLICRAPDRALHPLPPSVVAMVKREAMKPGWSCGATEAGLREVCSPECDSDPVMIRLLHSWDPIRANEAWDMIRCGLFVRDLTAKNPDNWREWWPGYYISVALVELLGLEMPRQLPI